MENNYFNIFPIPLLTMYGICLGDLQSALHRRVYHGVEPRGSHGLLQGKIGIV